MIKLLWLGLVIAVLWAGVLVLAQKPPDETWTKDFAQDKADLSPTGRNPYFILEPGYTLVLADGKEQLTVTVLDETREIDGVQTRVVEERETDGGQLVEVSRNFLPLAAAPTASITSAKRWIFTKKAKLPSTKAPGYPATRARNSASPCRACLCCGRVITRKSPRAWRWIGPKS